MSIENLILDFFINLIAGVIGILVVLWIERQRRPKISMEIGTPGTIDENDPMKRPVTTFLKVRVYNLNMPSPLSKVYDREQAFSCSGKVSFYKLDGQKLFDNDMTGRWSETLDPPPREFTKTKEGVIARLVNPQNTIDIPADEYRNLDVVNKLKGDDECYGWNNESYIHGWRHPTWQLDKGRYIAKVVIKTGGREFHDAFIIVNDAPFDDFKLEKATEEIKNRVIER